MHAPHSWRRHLRWVRCGWPDKMERGERGQTRAHRYCSDAGNYGERVVRRPRPSGMRGKRCRQGARRSRCAHCAAGQAMTSTIQRLGELHARATQGEWAHVLRGSRPVGHIRVPDGPFVFERGFGARIAADADLIVAMHRHLPALIALARAAEEEAERHKGSADPERPCPCSLCSTILCLTSTPTEATAGEG
jgi:hypothetical protein